jgi:hypothetical protein
MRSLLVFLSIGTVLVGCVHDKHALCPTGQGVGGPGPGIMAFEPPMATAGMTSQIAFVGPEGMTVAWDVGEAGMFDSTPLVCPGRYNFPQAAIYRLKLNNVPGRPGVDLYPTLEVGPSMPRTEAFLAHNAIPVQFTPEDFDQVVSGNFVTKVIYLPDPEYQELALAGVETLVSTRLDPGVDPIVEADRRGAILAIVRLGNKDLQAPGGEGEVGEVAAASYNVAQGGGVVGGAPMPQGIPVGGRSTMPTGVISGVTAPPYGMPVTGTPIGLAGPPYIPLGVEAGLRKHVVVNHTRVVAPEPTERVRLDVAQVPGYRYPRQPHHACIVGVNCTHKCSKCLEEEGSAPCENDSPAEQ